MKLFYFRNGKSLVITKYKGKGGIIMIKKLMLLVLTIVLSTMVSSCKEEVSFVSGGAIIESQSDYYIIDIKGAVLFPGVYSVESSALLIDVINLAGGLLENADSSNINLAMPVINNQMIIIPSKVSEVTKEDDLININTSSVSELTILPGIGDVKAQNIVDYRNKNGKFTSIEQLKNVSGISEALYNKIKTMVTL